MAFFGLTQTGYQSTIREHVSDPYYTPQYLFQSGLYRDKSNLEKLPPIDRAEGPNSRPSSSGTTDWVAVRERSAARLKEMRDKHVRSVAGLLR